MIFRARFICLKCGNLHTFIKNIDYDWCNIYSVKYMQENLCTWSGNERIDNFIKERQLQADHPKDFFEWIPYNRFENIEKTGKGEFYSAEWKDGYLKFYNEKNHEIHRHGELKVVLKCLKNWDDILNEV